MAKILIVDDDPGVRAITRTILKRDGHETVSAEDGLKALAAVKNEVFDLIVTDLRMPNMDGMSLLRAVKALDPSIPVILFTAYSSRETAIEAVRLGVFDYIAKPFKIHELKSIVDRALNTEKDKTRATDVYSGDNPAIKAYLESLKVQEPDGGRVVREAQAH